MDIRPNRVKDRLRQGRHALCFAAWGYSGADHWASIKALNRRFAEQTDNEFADLRPVAHLGGGFIEAISLFLDHPHGWTGLPPDDATRQTILAELRRLSADDVLHLANEYLATTELGSWERAYYRLHGKGSTYKRAGHIREIYRRAAPLEATHEDNLINTLGRCLAETFKDHARLAAHKL